jgi:hypothetical protein
MKEESINDMLNRVHREWWETATAWEKIKYTVYDIRNKISVWWLYKKHALL